MSVKIDYEIHSVNKTWKKAVKDSKQLSEDQKKALIKQAHKRVALENTKEIVLLILKVIAVIVFGAIFSTLFSYWMNSK